ncbi:aspartate--tRNA ligase [Paenibacillus polymyxa]|jgi:aspartyl-tRNA synthetase|uniref:Aspartate--tRNA ligase n=2 Tax=Paenibacillus polymyxa TaxID=1406 RepID=A0A0F6EQG5_PAEPO|nr:MULTISPECIES: aspartate--tRNA ligase [Paenibacillus]AHM67467.1 aspartyl-tRNA synthetase [Paenibacillus polymyxa SQR-21]AIY08229.1 aspartyl-tRNA synthetase [Paenibacillus polymyxa]KAF6586197.1 aspartate--tRNA ligase [Paenibacillus sp. EKM211P]KAF6615509.1 aspartate--tRNA ligase [Paenibacillus sp. EKM101P]KAF6619875.1 aspartate--tRNA ligase [Paenibacillus sp. EKM102P]
MKRSHQCGALTHAHIGETVTLNGWVQTRRDLGGVLFIDLRDRSGIVQIVFNPAYSGEALQIADRVRSEYVLEVTGTVVKRDAETINTNLPTGEIEVRVTEIEVLNASKTPPFFIEDGVEVDESLRLKYRYLDLRRPEMHQTLKLRSKAAKVFRDFLDGEDFIEVETPILTKSSPEGARDYLVPSRVHEGEFFALPQSPQLYKQLLMVGGLERYYQVARCFRDEDLRADRQPEFTQIDIETSFMQQDDLLPMMERLMVKLFKETVGVELETPFQRITHAEAMDKYGSDKPDLRFGLELINVNDIVATSGVKVFASVIEKGGEVKVLNAKGCGTWSRKDIDDLGPFAARYGAKGLAWIQVKEGEFKGPIVKFFTPEEIEALKERTGAEEGDLLLFSADNKKVVADVLGALRLKIGRHLGLIDDNKFKFAWVVDFPLLGYDEEQKRYVAEHHPFTRPKEEDLALLDTDPGQVRAQAYDIVLNGYEVGGGSMRIFKREVQEKMFKALNLPPEEVKDKFGYLLDAFEYGTPPHGGIAFGFDRLVMLLAGRTNLRETIAFPKTASATDLLMDAPAEVDQAQLDQLHIRLAPKPVAPKA